MTPICPWCVGFVASDPAHLHVSHGICPRCMELMLEQADAAATAKK